jgi:hypothetical protein
LRRKREGGAVLGFRKGLNKSLWFEQFAEKLDSATSAAKAFTAWRAFTAALEALRHPKPEFFSSL